MFSRRQQTKPVIETRTLPIPRRMLALEPRYVFDAALATELHDAAADTTSAEHAGTDAHDTGAAIVAAAHELETQSRAHGATVKDAATDRAIQDLVATHNLAPANHEIAFIDSRLADVSTLIASVPEGTRIVLIDGTRDGVAQMVDALRGEQGITGIHILSHGSEGHIELGSSTIDATTMSSIYRSALSSIHGNLAEGADILVYGCDFGAGADGAKAASMLATLTGADVAASTNLTGSVSGADWVLEEHTGSIEARTIISADWHHDLGPNDLDIAVSYPPTVTGNNTSSAVAVWTNAGTLGGVGGTPFDLRATVIATTGTATADFLPGTATFTTNGYSLNDPGFILYGANSTLTIKWEVFQAGTNQTVPLRGNAHLSYGDIDGGTAAESVRFETEVVSSYALNSSSVLSVANNGTTITASSTNGTNTNNLPNQRILFNLDNVNSWTTVYTSGVTGRGYVMDGNFETIADTSVTTVVNHPPALTDPDATPGTPYVDPSDSANLIVPAVDNAFVSIDLSSYYSDPENDALTFTPSMAGAPAWLSYDPVTHVLSGTPPIDNVGSTTISVSVSDGKGGVLASTITIEPVNPTPIANPDTVETAANTPVVVDLLANDIDPDNDPLTVTSATLANPAQGTLSQDPVTHVWTFTPATGFTGTATINYTMQDQDGATSSSTHTVTVNAPPALTDPDVGPTTPFINPADPANLIVPATDGSPVSLDLDTYYADPNGDPMTFTPDMTGAPAWLTYNPVTHVLSGTPPVDNVGPVTVPVSVTDGHGNTFASTITFSPTNPGPTAVADTTTTAAGASVVVPLLANDTDPDGDPLAVTAATLANPAQGTLSQDPVTHVWTFTPAPGFVGNATINYTIQDQDGATSSSTHTVAVNAPPALTDPDVGPTTPYINPADPANLIVPATDGSPVSIDLDTYYADPNGDPMTFTPNMTGVPAWLSYNPVTHVLSGTAPVDNAGPVTIPVSVTDGHGNTFASTITFSPVNPGPTAVTDTQETAAGTPVTLTLLANDTDPDGDPLSVTTASVPAAQGTVALVGGNWVFTPAPGFTGNATISYTIQDQDGATSSSTHTVAVNAPPALTDPDVGPTTPFINPADPANLIVPATDGSPVSIDLDTYYADPNGDPMTFTPDMTGVPAWLSYNPVTHVLSGTAPVDNVGPVTIPVSVTDGHGNTFASTITFSPTNPGPTAVADTTATAAGASVVVPLLANDTDPDGDPLTVTAATLANPAQGTLSQDPVTHVWTFTPAPGFVGNATISYTIQDQDGATSSSTHTVTVNAPPALTDPDVGPTTPYINPADPANLIVPATDGSPVSLDLDTYYADPNGDAMTFTPNMTGVPAWLSYNPVTHVLSGTAPVDNAGPVTIPVSVTDGHGNTFASTITFSPTNPGPTANADTQETAAGAPVTLALLANDTDPDGDPMTVTTASVPAAQGSVALVGGNWVFTPAPGFVGNATISYTIQDQDGATSSSTHTVTVNAPPALTDPDVGPTTPYINPADPANLIVPATDGSPVSVDLDTYYADPNGDAMTFTPNMTGVPAWLSYNPVTHVLSGTAPVDNAGPVTIPVSVTDGDGNTFASTITFSPTNPGPTANADTVTTGYTSAVVVNLLANDTDPDGDPLTVTSATLANPAAGTLSQDPVTHAWTFTPAAGFTGPATINYTIQDQDGATSSATHTVTVNAPALLAADDAFTTGYTAPLNGNAANGDVYAPGSIFAVAAAPGHGTVTMNADGTYVYTPAAGFAGTDTFTYRITDPAGQTTTGTETITVTAPTLIAVSDAYTTAFRTTLNANAAAGDTFAAGSTFAAVAPPAQGTLTMRPDGSYTYVPPTNFAGTVTFTYRVTDPVGQTQTATETITVSHPALVAIDHAVSTAANKPLITSASRGDTFATGSTFRSASAPAHGTVTMRTDGTYTYTPAKNFYGTDTFTYSITDPTGQVVTATETITVTPPPPLQRCLTTFAKLTGFRRR